MSYNNNHDNEDKKNKKSLYQFLDKEGFYIILFLCVCIVAVSAIWVSNQNQDPIVGEKPSQQGEEAPDVTLVEKDPTTDLEEASETVVIPQTKKEKKQEKPATKKEEETIKSEKTNEVKEVDETETAAEAKALQVMMMPVMGELGLEYADDHLVYHKTLDQWSTHRGIDIHAEEGTPVRAVMEGEVLEVINDTVMGITITLEHENEVLTRYSNLSTDAMVQVGDMVTKGQIISGVGTTASVKAEEGPLLHFQVIKDGKVVNPMTYLPENN
ncbi:M23 family metallopeptidase [Alkaliphilus hydrothermalis]|uniref:Murein DD-endopeptidase MepM/ murein hydrolase activator NlpD n=1 Tax=Alkaliphilus hydrothermalis TaxID=1482730 RepID=A0ABS2NQR5_9FIRM|nr:M23 family metallopeptidase [Alkaliphilus hydrothermalis]MBM7615137.1 murein DD-endopeptidase MepM/ murein hydrolase activator NlpD [Alkaliphilus hydrothermalis]